MKSKTNKTIIAFIMSIFFLFSVFVPTFKTTQAEGIFCGETFAGALKPGVAKKVLNGAGVLPNLGNRTYTIQELFGDSLSIARFNGEYEGDFLIGKKDEGLGEEISDAEATERLTKRGESYGCIPATIFSTGTNIIISLTSQVNNFATLITTTLFDVNFPEKDTSDSSLEGKAGNQITDIVGGEETGSGKSDDGIINDLAKSIYFPLLVLVGAFTGISLFYNAVVKRQIRDSFVSFGWVLFAILIGTFIATKPVMVARAPQKITSTVLGCIVDGLNGGNCLTGGGSSTPSSFIAKGCKSSSTDADVDEKASLNVNSLSCGIWKAMTLNSWTKAQFGYDFDELYTSGAPSGYSNYDLTKSGVDKDLFCIQTGSASSINQARKSGATFDSGTKICNIAAAQLAIQSGMENDSDKAIRKGIAKVALHDKVMFNSWGLTNGGQSSAIVGAIGTFFALFAILSIAIRGHIYSFLATISTAFAPLYALLAVHPGKGRRMFLGWLENIIGYILKFIFTATIVLVTVMLFGALMKNMSGMISLVSCIILSLTMRVYQKDFVAFVGQADLGGAKVSKNMGDLMNEKLDKGEEKVKNAGGLVAGTLLGEKLSSSKTGETPQYGQAIGDALTRAASRNRGVLGSTARQYRRGSNLKRSQQKEADRQRQRAQDSANNSKAIKDSLNTMNQGGNNSQEKTSKVKIPNLIGSDLTMAESLLAQNGLKMNITETIPTTNVKDFNKVASQSITPGTEVMVGMIVDLSVYEQDEEEKSSSNNTSSPNTNTGDNTNKTETESNGNREETPSTMDHIINTGNNAGVLKVPDVVGHDLTMAQSKLNDRGFSNVSIEKQKGGNLPNVVLSQSPTGGTACSKGTPIKLIVSEEVVLGSKGLPNLNNLDYSDQSVYSYDSNGNTVSSSRNIIQEHNSLKNEIPTEEDIQKETNRNFMNNVVTKEEKEVLAKIKIDKDNGKEIDSSQLTPELKQKLSFLGQQKDMLKRDLNNGSNASMGIVKELSLRNDLNENYQKDMENMSEKDRELLKDVINDASRGVIPAQNVLKQYDEAFNNLTLLDKNKKEIDGDSKREFIKGDRTAILEDYSRQKGNLLGDKVVMDSNAVEKLNKELKDTIKDTVEEKVLINTNVDTSSSLKINSNSNIAEDVARQIKANPGLGVLNNKEETINKAMGQIERETMKPENERISFDMQELSKQVETLYNQNKKDFDMVKENPSKSDFSLNNVKNQDELTKQVLEKIKEDPSIIVKDKNGDFNLKGTMNKIGKAAKEEEKNQNSTVDLKSIRENLKNGITDKDISMNRKDFRKK